MSMLETTNLHKRFGELQAVDDVNLSIDREGIHSIIGPNGAGKSTLFHLLTGYLNPTGGEIRYKDEDIAGLPPRKIVQKGISRSFQIADLFEGLTVKENLQIATQALDEKRNSLWVDSESLTTTLEKTEQLLEDIELVDLADVRADALSHGDQRKLEIGLALAVEPDLILLDEPTAGMGKQESVQMVRLIRRLVDERDIKLILIEHDIGIVMRISDRISVLNRGQIIAEGSPEEIQQNERVQEAYIGTKRGEASE
ncbi:ABC transporter ATP-binding protein [Halobellus clavatus]|uniref:Probable branched-chain amino acid transport ATP-binding protein LivG n=1 Tax=Halobellus clavatus TaxID=660517 RepID=A0A1H3E9W6_9EURY|nr:ABC transporter ATP-binding protein [Halobellus clavatus]SDX74679.1 branched-chain amino acid transport system ATP-binding protein [Halobellus clavatus]